MFGGVEGAIGGSIGLVVGGPGGAAVGAAIGAQVAGIRKALGSVAEYSAELGKLRIALQGVSASQFEYNFALELIQQATQDFAIPQSVLTKQFTKLQASVSGAGGSLNDTNTAFRGIVAAVRATGGSLTDVDAALTATAQVFSKGKVSAEELRQQIGERLPGAFTIFAESIGKTPAELDKALEKGQVSLQDFQTFAESLFDRYGETAQKIADDPKSAGDRLQVALEKLQENIGPILEKIGSEFQKLATIAVNAFSSIANAINKTFNLGEEGKLRTANAIRNTQDRLIAQFTEQLQSGNLSAREAASVTKLLNLAYTRRNLAEADIRQINISRQGRNRFGPGIVEDRPGLPGISDDPPKPTGGASAASKIKEITQQEYDLRLQILKAKADGRELDVLGYEFALERLKIDQSNLGELAKQIALKELTQKADEKLLQFGLQQLEVFSKSFAAKQKALEEENKLYEEQKMKILETSIAVGAISEEEGKRIKRAMKLQEIAADYNVTLETAAKIYERQNQVVKEQEDIWKTIGDSIKGSIGQALDDLIFGTESLRESLTGILKSLGRTFLQIGTKSLFSAIGFAGGGVMTREGPLDLKTYARGGIANSPQVALFGEGSMPEAYVPLPDGRSIPVTMQGGGNRVNVGSVNITVENTGEDLQPAAQKQLAGQVRGLVLSTLADERRSGGILR